MMLKPTRMVLVPSRSDTLEAFPIAAKAGLKQVRRGHYVVAVHLRGARIICYWESNFHLNLSIYGDT